MKRYVSLLAALILVPVLYGQEVPIEEGDLLATGKTATLGVEASTGFAWDIENKSTGLETKAGLELIFPLFPLADRGVGLSQNSFEDPAVRLAIRNASFTWWNTYQTRGGNYEQDDFNSWQARPLVLSFDTFSADLVWTNYFFRVASSTTVMQTDVISLFSIFDDVMDAGDRWYVRRRQTEALWTADRYNIQQLPLLKEKIQRDYLDDDYRSAISGMLAFGAEFDWFSAALKMASNKGGRENNDNAWLFGADIELVPLENLKFELTGFAGVNYEKTDVGKNPISLGAGVEYQMPLTDRFILTPKIGFDFTHDTASEETEWELGAGVIVNTRGYDPIASSRILDWDEVIPIGASFSMSVNNDSGLHAMLSWFEPAGTESLLPNFGGFLQLEMANLLGANDTLSAIGVLAQVEYMIAGKFVPYIRAGYVPVFRSESSITGDYLIKAIVGCYMTPVHFFSVDLRYEMDNRLLDAGGSEIAGNILSVVFTIRM